MLEIWNYWKEGPENIDIDKVLIYSQRVGFWSRNIWKWNVHHLEIEVHHFEQQNGFMSRLRKLAFINLCLAYSPRQLEVPAVLLFDFWLFIAQAQGLHWTGSHNLNSAV